LTVGGSMASGFSVTWSVAGVESLLAVDASNLLPECDIIIGERRAGTVSLREQQFIKIRTRPAAYQDTFTDLSTAITASVAQTQTGSASASEIQTISFDKKPVSGQFSITLPTVSRTITSVVVAGLFTTTTNHGLSLNQPIVFASLTNPANVANATTYFIKETPTKTTFTIAATSGGTAITTATADAGAATVATVAETSGAIAYSANAETVQSALEAMTAIGSGNVSVSGVAGSFFTVVFTVAKELVSMPEFTVEDAGLQGAYGKTGDFSLATYGIADLLNGLSSVETTLECQLTESGDVTTVAQATITVTADVIEGNTLGSIAIAASVPSHASTHATGGSDPISPSAIGAVQYVTFEPSSLTDFNGSGGGTPYASGYYKAADNLYEYTFKAGWTKWKQTPLASS